LKGGNPLTYAYFAYDGPGHHSGRLVYVTQFNAVATNPNLTYTLAEFDFQHGNTFLGAGTRPDSCGCTERPVCIKVQSITYFDETLRESYFNRGRNWLTWNDFGNSNICPDGPDLCNPDCLPPDSTCVATTPGHARSWGEIKAQYRSRSR
jgi:hypothetical protein